MHAERLPPGQPEGDGAGPGGVGPGEGPGDGPGDPPSVEPISPKRMLEKVTDESGTLVSTSSGLPESAEHVPRATPGVDALWSAG